MFLILSSIQSIFFSTQKKKKEESYIGEEEESLDDHMDIKNENQTMLINASFDTNQQQNKLNSSSVMTTSSSYGTMVNSNLNYSFDPRLYQDQPNPYFVNYQTCYKCENMIYFNMGHFYTCFSCNRLCCISCMNTYGFPTSCNYQCEYCYLNVTLQTARC